MIGSPDLLAFTGAEGFGEGEEDEAQSLPEELSVPLLPPSQPWSSSAQFARDFILVAEFSEQVGPKPVLTIPDDPRVVGSFDLNHFSVRLMSVDYQASCPTPVPPASPGPRLNFSEDSRVILGDSAEDAFAYVHHMTLYDLEARGMVRPFCVAYVCSDQMKLMENFGELSSCFSQASDSLKTGNRQAFSLELQRKLHELEFTRLTLLEETEHQNVENGSAAAAGKGEELEAVEHLISNHRELLRQVTSYPNRKLKQPDFLPYDTTDSLTDPLLFPDPCHSLSSSVSASWKSGHRLKHLHELCNSYFLSLMMEQLADTLGRLRGDRSVLRTAHVTRALSRKLSLVNFLFELCPEDEGELQTTEAEMGTKSGADLFQSDPMSLESFLSCVEEIPIKLEAGEVARLSPMHSVAMEMASSVSSSDSIEVLGTEKSYRMQQVVATSSSRETPAGTADASHRRPTADGGVRRVRAYARRENSEDSIEVLSTTESIFPDDLTAIREEEAEQHLGQESEEEGPRVHAEGAPDATDPGDDDGSNDRLDTHEPPEPAPANGDVLKGEQIVTCAESSRVQEDATTRLSKIWRGAALKSRLQLPEGHQTGSSTPDVRVNSAEAERWTSPILPLRQLSIDEASDRTSFTGSSDPPSPIQYVHSSSLVSDRRKRRRAAVRALRFLRQNSFSQHALFCLLSGRPLVVIGGEENMIRNLVDGLSLFLPAPGPDGNAVMACLSSPLQVTDLLTWRLIGVHSILHSLTRYSRYLALLDLDQRTLHCPSYSGSLINRFANPQARIQRGITYLLHLESGLTALTNQALLYTFCRDLQRLNTAGGEGSALGDHFLLARGYCGDDVSVMHFLSDLIKQHHAGRGPPFLRFSYSSRQLHRNTQGT
ncbi:Guanine nucleotide exchange protein SMCR8 [Takifugu flavidus]|uniref:Guanine nucleotide exchange protein SMCR8 n=1 Tax=Takifugu flavidus TaxID=433684 RepID=A0A5C6MVI4_9TELE|nr:Guanine nucleotide exchange protein SMCR8 [Takifugu flavidus]